MARARSAYFARRPGQRADPRAAIAKWFEAIDPRARREPRSYAAFYTVPPLVAAWVVALVAPGLTVRVAVPVVLALVAVLVFFKARRAARLVDRRGDGSGSRSVDAPRPRRGLGLSADRLTFEGAGGPSDLLYTDAPFGVTLLTDRKRERLTALLSSSVARSIGARLGDAAGPRLGALAAAASIAGDELGLDAIGPDGEPLLLGDEDFATLLERLAQSNPGCLDEVVLSDARGTPITLDAARLQIGERSFDLDAPLEWRSLVFREALGNAHAYYQGTWVRQGPLELVLVSLLPAQPADGRRRRPRRARSRRHPRPPVDAGLDRGAAAERAARRDRAPLHAPAPRRLGPRAAPVAPAESRPGLEADSTAWVGSKRMPALTRGSERT